VVTALDRKLLRDLRGMAGQTVAIGAILACGLALFVMALSTLGSLEGALGRYYERNRFAQVFAHVKRAPDPLARRIAEVPGVAQVETRIVVDVLLDVEGLAEPATGRVVSLPEHGGPPGLNQPYLRKGRFPEPDREDEVLVGEGFAAANGLGPGSHVRAVINGRLRRLHVVGVALSPEYVYAIRPGEVLPDERRYGIIWMGYDGLAAAFDMDGAFNDVALTLTPGASEPDVIARLDRLTGEYGGLGAYGRDDQMSHKFLSNEIRELRTMAVFVPAIFLAVTGFLLNVVVSRQIQTQREQIAALKAFGYTDLEVGWHYVKLVLAIAGAAAAVGTAAGAYLGRELTELYTDFFHFPTFDYRLPAWVVLLAAGVSVGAAVLGAVFAVRRAVVLPPAEAMRPEPPGVFRPTVLERLGLQRYFPPSVRMILRNVERQPVRSLSTVVGLALATAGPVLGEFMGDAIDYAIETQYGWAQRQQVTVTFVEPTGPDAIYELAHLRGVRAVEPVRALGVRLRAGPRHRRVGVLGVKPDGELFRLIDLDRNRVELPPDGIVLSKKLAELIEVSPGDHIRVEVLEGERPVRGVVVSGLIDDFSGMTAYMSVRAVNDLMREGEVATGAYLAADPAALGEVYTRLKGAPRVAGVTIKSAAVENFRETIAENLLRMKAVNIFFACVIAFGVVYNAARITVAERGRELATLRVIGFTRGEISLVLLGELALLTLVALPAGLLAGYGFAYSLVRMSDTELFRIPLVVESSTYAFASVVVVLAAVGSGLVARRRLDRLDLVAVLKAKE
jgi:putative ABC transport system permease protein